PRSLEGRPRGAHRHLVRGTDREGRERERRGRPRRRRAPLAHLGRGFLRLAQPLGVAEHALPRGLRIQLGHFRLERLEALHAFPPPAASPRICFTVSALMDVSLTAWNATSRFSAPISSRTLPTSACATVSSTPGSNRAPRSSALRRRIATRVS